jgi:hypothetical protein
MSAFGRASRVVICGAILWLFIAGLLALQVWPHLPESVSGWVAFIAFGPPLYVLIEAAAEWLWSSRSGRAISDHPSSVVRVLLGVLVIGVVCVLVWAALWLLAKA